MLRKLKVHQDTIVLCRELQRICRLSCSAAESRNLCGVDCAPAEDFPALPPRNKSLQKVCTCSTCSKKCFAIRLAMRSCPRSKSLHTLMRVGQQLRIQLCLCGPCTNDAFALLAAC